MYSINVSCHTDKGDKKDINQDNILVRTGEINSYPVGLFIVADGCGGLEYGEEISGLIVRYFEHIWDYELEELLSSKKLNLEKINNFLDSAIADINERAVAFGKQAGSRVGSTLSLLFTVGRQYWIKNVGDSRVYLKRGSGITQLTQDQSLVADMVRRGEITDEQAKKHKKKNVLTMCVGVSRELHIYSKNGKIKNKDVFILCSDGLHNHVSRDQISDIIVDRHTAFEDKAYILRSCIEYGKAGDNVSSVVCGYRFTRKKLKVLLIIATAVIVLATAAVIFRGELSGFIENMTGGYITLPMNLDWKN